MATAEYSHLQPTTLCNAAGETVFGYELAVLELLHSVLVDSYNRFLCTYLVFFVSLEVMETLSQS